MAMIELNRSKTRVRLVTTCLVTAFLVLIAASLEAASKDHFAWSSEDGSQEIQVISFVDANDHGVTKMILFELSNGERFVFYDILDARSGLSWERFEHDSSDWWIQFGTDMHGEFENSRDYFDHVFEISPPPSDVDKHITPFLKAENFLYEKTYDYTPRQGGKLMKKFRKSALAQEKCIELARSIPPNIREGLFYLSRFEYQVKYNYLELIDFLVLLLESAGFESDLEQEEFIFERVGYEWGLGTMVTPEELEFTSRFESVDNADPFAGFRPEELFPEE